MNPRLKIKLDKARACLSSPQRKLLNDVEVIINSLQKNHISDYSFLVAPLAKAYEGYLKDFFLKIGIIDQNAYNSDRFRVGKTLNPSLRYKRFSIFQKLSDLDSQGEEMAEILWTAWKLGRNEIFHYFPHNLKNLTQNEAEDRLEMILQAIIQSSEFIKQEACQKHQSVII